jgi:hypothetical protein
VAPGLVAIFDIDTTARGYLKGSIRERDPHPWSASVDESGEPAGVTYSIATESFEKTSATMMMR